MGNKGKKKTITLELTDYLVCGTAYVTLWDDTNVEVKMREYHVNSLDLEEIFDGVNDGGMGCRSIDRVDFTLFENYGGYLVSHVSLIIDKFPSGYGKRGI